MPMTKEPNINQQAASPDEILFPPLPLENGSENESVLESICAI